MPDLFENPQVVLAAKGAKGQKGDDGKGGAVSLIGDNVIDVSSTLSGSTTVWTIGVNPGGEGQILSVVGGVPAWIPTLNQDAISEEAAQAATFKYAAQTNVVGGNAYTFEFTPAITGYTDGMFLVTLVNTANTADNVTVNLGGGVVALRKNDGSEYLSGQLTAGYYILVFQGSTNSFRVVAEEVPKYTTSIADGTTVPETVGGVTVDTDIATLKNKPLSSIIDLILFPTVPASIVSNKSASLAVTGGSGNYEMGTSLSLTLTTSFNKGVIDTYTAGGAPTTLDLVGAASQYLVSGTTAGGLPSSGLVPTSINLIVNLGSNSWTTQVTHAAGSGTVFDSAGGNTQDFPASARDAGTVTSPASSPSITGYFARFYGATASTPTNSTAVRALPSGAQLDTNNTFTLNTGNTQNTFTICLPPGRTLVSVINETALNTPVTYVDLGEIDVADPSGAIHSYTKYELTLPGGPYSQNQVHNVTIS